MKASSRKAASFDWNWNQNKEDTNQQIQAEDLMTKRYTDEEHWMTWKTS